MATVLLYIIAAVVVAGFIQLCVSEDKKHKNVEEMLGVLHDIHGAIERGNRLRQR